jgi:cysteine desulfurase
VAHRKPVYLDHAASTPLDAAVTDAVMRVLACTGSPDALHPSGGSAAALLENARAQVAALIGADPDEVIFTAGATEARNLAVKGLLSANRARGRHAVASVVEHPAVLSALHSRQREGHEVSFVGVDRDGYISPETLAAAMTADTALVSVHHAQHEIGTIQDLGGLISAVRGRRADARIHIDAAESTGIIGIDVGDLGADALTMGGTALGAPPWSGALWLRPGARLHPLIEGGSQEFGKRAGPVDLAGAVALGVAANRVRTRIATRAAKRRRQTELLAARVLGIADVRLNGPALADRLPGHLQVSVRGVTGESLALALATRGVEVSPGSTCTADAGKASPTLEAIGRDSVWTHSAILMTIGDATTDEELRRAAAVLASVVADLRAMSPLDA